MPHHILMEVLIVYKLYNAMAGISLLIRQFCIPNPFEGMQNGELYNLIAGAVLYPVTFFIVGLFYEGGTFPALGSFLYLAFYFINTGILMLMGHFGWNKMAIWIIAIGYILILAGLKKLHSLIFDSF